MVLAAQSYKQQRVAEAQGNTTRFLELLAEYQKAPGVTGADLPGTMRSAPEGQEVVIDPSVARTVSSTLAVDPDAA